MQKSHESLSFSCPLCTTSNPVPFLVRHNVPVHQNALVEDPVAARGVRRGTLDLRICSSCGFICNVRFDPDLVNYDLHYDNTQTHSPAFSDHVDRLVRLLIEGHGIRGQQIVEVGCGKGAFLKRLVTYPGANNTGIGFDPTYVGPDLDCDGRVRFERSFYGPETAVAADAVVCRHVIEHVPDPMEFLLAIHGALEPSRNVHIYFETPCVEWILRHGVVWDFFYEHCSLFTAHSLERTFQAAGFTVKQSTHVFGEQYLALIATSSERKTSARSAPISVHELMELALRFGQREETLKSRWLDRLSELSRLGRIAIWGAGAKGATFCNLIDPEAQQLACVVDVNPTKQGKFIAGTGHPIVAPGQLEQERIAVVLVLNPNYTTEVARQVAGLGLNLRVIDLMEEGEFIHAVNHRHREETADGGTGRGAA